MIDDVLCLRFVDFSTVTLLCLDYTKQTEISEERVDLLPPALSTMDLTQAWLSATSKGNMSVRTGMQMPSSHKYLPTSTMKNANTSNG